MTAKFPPGKDQGSTPDNGNETLDVLVVDDEPGMRVGVRRVLRDHHVSIPRVEGTIGFDLREAESGEEALRCIETNCPDILLLDHKLPGISGLEVLSTIQPDEDTDVPLVIMVTAYASIEIAVTATKRGAYDFLAKPFTPTELRNVVGKAAGRVVLERHTRRLAEEKRRVRFEFIRLLGHELKAPIAAVKGYLDMLDRQSLGPNLDQYEKCIERSRLRLEGMNKLIIDLLDLTRIESGQGKRELTDVDLKETLDTAVELANVSARAREVSVAAECNGPLTMRADRSEIDMVLNNLLSNAVKYNRHGGRVRASIGQEGDHVVARVSDTGIGMSAENLEKLFGEFVRIKNRETRHILGSGLGLSIVRKIARIYGGDVQVDSQLGVGSTFTVRLRKDGGDRGSD
ncbi:MAG: ATP-binding response regulator [Planctomycetota bacterium]